MNVLIAAGSILVIFFTAMYLLPGDEASPYVPRHAYTPPVTLVIKPDVAQTLAALQQAARGARVVGEAYAKFFSEKFIPAFREMVKGLSDPATSRKVRVLVLQSTHGLGNWDGAGLWQSDLCAAWVHTSCPLPEHCDCGCHR